MTNGHAFGMGGDTYEDRRFWKEETQEDRHGKQRMQEIRLKETLLGQEERKADREYKKARKKFEWHERKKELARKQKMTSMMTLASHNGLGTHNYKELKSFLQLSEPKMPAMKKIKKTDSIPPWLKELHVQSKLGYKPQKGSGGKTRWVRKSPDDTEDYSSRWYKDFSTGKGVWMRKKKYKETLPAHIASSPYMKGLGNMFF